MSLPRILLLQVRDENDPMRTHELECFSRKLSAPVEFLVRNLLFHPPEEELLQEVDILMIGGSGDYSCVDNRSAWFQRGCRFLRAAVDMGLPLFASCWGIQHLAVALGGAVEHAGDEREIGTYPVHLTEEGRGDPLFGHLPDPFLAQLGHKDRVSRPPPGAVVLARSERCQVQAFRLEGRVVYATQFHPELTASENLERMHRYRCHYERETDNYEAMLGNFRERRDTVELLPRFLSLALAGRRAGD